MVLLLAVAIPYTAITIIFVILAAVVGAFVRRRTRDKCLRDFEHNTITLEQTSGKRVWGRFRVEHTGLEFIYPQKHYDKDGHEETSYLLYKHEYSTIAALVRYHHLLSQANKEHRQRQLKRTYHPSLWRRMMRKLLNIFRTLRDSVMEVTNLLITQARKATPAGKVLVSQDKYVTRMKQELMGSVAASYEPLLESYIGRRVVLEVIKDDTIVEYVGVLKEYSADFIEIMDVDYPDPDRGCTCKADLIVPRKLGLVRHLAE